MVVLLPHMRDKQRLLVDEQVDETAEGGGRIIDTVIGSLAEEIRQQSGCLYISQLRRGAQFIKDATDKHRLAFARVTFDPEYPALFVVAPLLKVRVFKDPPVRVSQ